MTLWLLSTDNLPRPAAELDPLMQIIEELVDDLARPRNPGSCAWSARWTCCRRRRRPCSRPRRTDRPAGARGQHRRRLRRAPGDRRRGPLAALRARRRGDTLEELAELLDVDRIAEHLYTKGQPDPDLVIRTSGEQRLCGFLLWQSAHSEFYFCDAYWPDFRRIDFLRALRSYAARHRRYGT